MKQTYFQIMTTLVALSLFSCQKDVELTQEPADKHISAEEVSQAVDALYYVGVPTFYGECSTSDVPAAAIGGYLSGFFEAETGTESKLYNNCRLLSLEGMADYTIYIWNAAYNAIGNCNEVIENAALTSGISDEQKNRFAAEARFFRAFNYFYLVRAFGDIPLVISGALNDDTGKSDMSQVYELIVSDLNRAIAELPDKGFAENGFRIGRPAAQMLLADVYLTMSGYPLQKNCYKQAYETAQEIIEGKKHMLIPNGGTSQTSAYNILRTQNDNRECIYTYNSQKSSPGRLMSALCLSAEAGQWGVVKIHTSNAYRPTTSLLNIYESGEDMRIEEKQLFHSYVNYENNGRTVIQTFSSMPYWWFDREALFGTGKSQQNIIIYRYAEVLLIAAEAIAMSEGVTPEAAGYLADVRSRAYSKIDRETIINQLTALSVDEFVREIWTERLREFPLEMKIWQDIQRTRKYPVAASGDNDKVTFCDVVGAVSRFNVAFTEKHLLLPAPKK